MRRSSRSRLRLFAETFEPVGRIIEVGSFHPPGSAWLCDLRPLFPGSEYIGCDIRPGTGVDRIEDAENLTFGDSTADVVILSDILEHLRDPDRAVSEAHRILVDHGLLVVSVPFEYRLHGFPTDYWRFTGSGVDQMLGGFGDSIVFSLGPRLKPAFVFAVAIKRGSPDFTARKAAFRPAVVAWSKATRRRGFVSVLKERARNFLGLLLGRAELGVFFFDATQPGGYLSAPRAVTGDCFGAPDYPDP
jgi:SAM-dependent methyltransferase